MLKPILNTCMAAVLWLLLSRALLAQRVEPRTLPVNVAIMPIDVSVGASQDTLQQPKTHDSMSSAGNSSGSANPEKAFTLGSSSGGGGGLSSTPNQTQAPSSAVSAVWGPQAAAPSTSLSASMWSHPDNSQSAGCSSQSGGDSRSNGQNGPTNATPGQQDTNSSAVANCLPAAALGQPPMQKPRANGKSASQSVTASTSGSSRLQAVRLQIADASASGILHYQSSTPTASQPLSSGSLSDQVKPTMSQTSGSPRSTSAKSSPFGTGANSYGGPRSNQRRFARSMHRGGHHLRTRKSENKNQPSSGHCSDSKSPAMTDISSGEPCQPSHMGDSGQVSDSLY